MVGKKYGRLTVISKAGRNKHGKQLFECKCACGNKTTVERGSIRSGNTKSCGCYKQEMAIKANRTHGMTNTPLYNSWRAMQERCNNPNASNYKIYGGRGVAICSEWLEFEPFARWAMANGFQPGLWIERIDNNGNYEPSNCKWATREEQSNNRRNNHMVTFRSKTMSIAQWSRVTGIRYSTLRSRFNDGWPPERALTTPAGAKTGPKPRLTATYRGETKTLSEWAEQYGVDYGVLRGRLDRGWSFQAATGRMTRVAGKGERK